MPYFDVIKKDSSSLARNGVIHTSHGDVNTPAFLPIGTKGTVKAVTSEELKFWGAEMILANTYHLWQRPGDALIYKAGGLHKFMNWKGPIFTDSGGFQVFSLAKMRKVMEAGVLFQFDLDGRQEILSPEKSVQIQANLGSDVALILDDFPGYPFEHERSVESIALTKRWAERAQKEFLNIMRHGDPINPGQKLWGIVQGASFPDLRKQSAKDMTGLGFEAFAIGGVAVGEPHEEMMKAVEAAIPFLPENSPKHLLGVGTPFNIVQAVARGCDTFDCVIPTREARHGRLYISAKNIPTPTTPSRFANHPSLTGGEAPHLSEITAESFPLARGSAAEGGEGVVEGYKTIDIRLEKYKEDFTTIDETCDCYLCLNHTKSYLRHLFAAGEPLSTRLASMHNLRFYLNLMKKIRTAIQYDYFDEMAANYRDYTGAAQSGVER
ncbi:MAG: tRNA guanosine(34) transglycosylase Tgt [Candidatus Doudnabacteria bacterium]|nr:tRNA guanosine(34) transglycosylase Tgt [Candidatus Doudnabacteria bacterium]